MKKVCWICGNEESMHHEPDYVAVPDSCHCDLGTWEKLPKIPEPCEAFQGQEGKPCRRCEHDKECHKC